MMTAAAAPDSPGRSAAPSAPFDSPSLHQLRTFSSWKDFVHDNFPWLEHRNHAGSDFEARVKACRLPNAVLSTISAGASEVVRTRHLAEATEAGFIKLVWQLSGRLQLEQDGRDCVIDVAQVAVCDTARPYRIRLSAQASFAVLMLPYDALPHWESIGPQVCATKRMDGAIARSAFGALMALTSLPVAAEGNEAEPVLGAVQQMLSTALLRACGRSAQDLATDARIDRVRRYIVERLADPGLNPDGLASFLCMSRRSLYMLFRDHGGTPTRMIHDIRLETARQYLMDPRHRYRKAIDIATNAGFADYATFSRLFKERFGMTPSECRLKRADAIPA